MITDIHLRITSLIIIVIFLTYHQLALPKQGKTTRASTTTASRLWPIFNCYRHVDGISAACLLHETLDKWKTTGPDDKTIELDVFLYETMPRVED